MTIISANSMSWGFVATQCAVFTISISRSCAINRNGIIAPHKTSFRFLTSRSARPIALYKANMHEDRALDEINGSGNHFDDFVSLGNELADAAASITLKYFRTRIEIIDKMDRSPVTAADQEAEEVMQSLIIQRFPSHAIFGEEGGLTRQANESEYMWVLDPIDGTKSFITGKPVFGTLIALLHKGVPVFGVIDQPVLHERWVGKRGYPTTLNGQPIATRSCNSLAGAYLYTTSPHLFSTHAMESFNRLREKVKVPLYGCDCYAYGLLAAGHVDLVVEAGLKPYDYLALVPVIEGAGGIITNWNGESLRWWPNNVESTGWMENVIACGDKSLHKVALDTLCWK